MDDILPTSPDDEPEGGAMSDDELVAHLDDHHRRAVGYYTSEIAKEQEEAINRYYRRAYGDEQAGRSKVVDATVAITVDNALAAVLKPFVSTDDTVAFEPRQKEDEEQAQQATEFVNYVLHNDNNGFLIFHDWFKDALLQKLGVVKVWWEDSSRDKPCRLENLDPMQVEMIANEEQIIGGPYGPDEYGLYSVDILKRYEDGCVKIANVPPEEYRISPLARPGCVPPYEAHITNKARSELIEMGFDPETVEALSKVSGELHDDPRAQARYRDENYISASLEQAGDASRELVEVHDEYALIDYDGDGVSELRHIIRSGDIILLNEEVEEGPFARLCPVPMPHKVYGQSLADQVLDEQRIATVLWRQTLDNLYHANNPRLQIPQSAERSDGSTVDDLLDDSFGAAIRVGSSEIVPLVIPFVADKSFPMLDYIGMQAESRTGISKQGQGMDPDAIDKAGQVTATQAAIMEDGRNARSELIARIFAETGVKDLFKRILRLLVQHQPRARMIRLRNEWVEMDPRSWNAEMDLSISVGLGLGNKAQQIAVADGVLETIAMAKQDPSAGSLFTLEHIYNAIKRKFTAAGIKNIDDFIKEPEKDEQGNLAQQDTPPDPETQKAMAELQLKQAELQAKQEEAQLKLQMQREDAQLKAQLAREEAAAKIQLERDKAAAEMELAREKMAMEMQIAERQMAMKEHMAERDAARRESESEAKFSTNREGGDLDK